MIRPTTEGWLAVLGAVALLVVALWSGNNALVLIATPVWAVLLLGAGIGARNVAGLTIERHWPSELVAGRSGRGGLVLQRGVGASHELVVSDHAMAAATVPEVRGRARVPCTWRFERRGPAAVTGLTVSSTWPFGLFAHTRRVDAPQEVLVGVRPSPSGLPGGVSMGDGRPGVRGRTGTGELVGLRSYAPGDPLRRVHWPTSARVGAPIVVERTEDDDHAVIVEVEARSTGPAWERELSRAAGQIQRAVRHGRRVGLRVPAIGGHDAVGYPARTGEGWRRHLLDVLARLPEVAP